jgi:purine-nucleoside phosphorylase
MKNAYDRTLRRRAKEAAQAIGLTLKEGVYTMMGGPNFETPAELKIMKMQGVDAVGKN